ncbi:hypothetical protein D3C81_1653850 [compost metagenome]
MLKLSRDGQEAEYERNNENVIHGQGLLDQETCHVIHAGVASFLEVNPDCEQKPHADVARRQQ